MAAVILDRHIRVGIVDDNELVRKTLHSVLDCSPIIQVVAEAADGSDDIAMVEVYRPDVVPMDISMPVFEGVEATRIVSSRFLDTKVVVLSFHNDQIYFDASLQFGACRSCPNIAAGRSSA